MHAQFVPLAGQLRLVVDAILDHREHVLGRDARHSSGSIPRIPPIRGGQLNS
jgi:hypothetical protein